MNKIGVPYFISHGTLLGWYRECGFIRHTTDVDIGIPIEDLLLRKDDIKNAFIEVGITPWKSFGSAEMGLEFSFQDKASKSKMDIFSFYHEYVIRDGKQIPQIFNWVWYKSEFARKMSFPLEGFMKVNLSNVVVYAPSNVYIYIIFNKKIMFFFFF